MSSDYDIEMTTDETLELDAIISNWSNPDTVVDLNSSDFNMSGFQTSTAVLDPQSSGEYTIKVNGQELTVKVNKASAIPDSAVFDGWEDNKLTNRDDFSTTPYEFNPIPRSTNTTRAEYSIQIDDYGSISASNGVLEYSWQETRPVTLVGARKDIDISNGITIYIEFEGGTPQSFSTESSFSFTISENAADRSNNSVIRISFSTDNQLSVFANGSSVISGSSTINENTRYGLLTSRDGSGNWELYFDPSDPKNPQQSELIGTGQSSFVPDMSGNDSGFYFTTDNGYGTVQTIHRLEIF